MRGLEQQINDSFEDDQEDLPGMEEGSEEKKFSDFLLAMGRADKFDVEIVVKLKASRDGSKVAQIPVAKLDGCPRERVEEMIQLAVKQEWFRDQLRGVVGQPSPDPLEIEEVEH